MSTKTISELLEESNNNFSAITINQDMTIAKTMDTIITKNIKSIVYVVDNQNKIQGFISVGNIAKHIYYGNIFSSTSLFPASSILHYLTTEFVKDIMDKNFIYCTKDDNLEDVLSKMLNQKVFESIPVVDSGMHILSSIDITDLMQNYL